MTPDLCIIGAGPAGIAAAREGLALGARVVGVDLARMIVSTWLDAGFEGGRHQRRVDLIMETESEERGLREDGGRRKLS